MLSKKVLLHHDNARPHTAAATVETVQQLGFELLQHPPYSPDLAPSDYHRFASDEEVKKAVHTWLREQPKSFFSAGIQKLVERYNKCIVLQGDYVEKLYVKLLSVTCITAVKCILPLLFESPSYINLPRVLPPQLLISRHETDTRTIFSSCISNRCTSEVYPTTCHEGTEGRVWRYFFFVAAIGGGGWGGVVKATPRSGR